MKRQKNKLVQFVQIVQIITAIMVVSKESSLRALFLRGTVEPPFLILFSVVVNVIDSAYLERIMDEDVIDISHCPKEEARKHLRRLQQFYTSPCLYCTCEKYQEWYKRCNRFKR